MDAKDFPPSLATHLDVSADANIAPAKAKDFDASGSVMEPDIKNAIDVDHPAVDNNPRAGTTVDMNRIDFNMPSNLLGLSEDEVAAALSNEKPAAPKAKAANAPV